MGLRWASRVQHFVQLWGQGPLNQIGRKHRNGSGSGHFDNTVVRVVMRGHSWGVLPDHLEREDIPVPLTDEQKKRLGEGALVKFRDEVTERLAMRPQRRRSSCHGMYLLTPALGSPSALYVHRQESIKSAIVVGSNPAIPAI